MNLAELASANGLHRVGARPRLWSYLAETWYRRDFFFTMASYRMRSSLETNRLGVFWLILRPILDAVIYGTIFGLLQGDNRPPDYAVYVVTGVFLFQFFTKCLNSGSRSITKNRALVQSLAFPRITLALSEVCEQFLSLLPSLALLLVFLPVMGHYPNPQWLFLIPLLVLY
ncbi:MAG: ABC transporter permease, partial [Propionibacteriaceae bacterium]|nr:ABC transporter permease [Propionibacteriaceae bacterium]